MIEYIIWGVGIYLLIGVSIVVWTSLKLAEWPDIWTSIWASSLGAPIIIWIFLEHYWEQYYYRKKYSDEIENTYQFCKKLYFLYGDAGGNLKHEIGEWDKKLREEYIEGIYDLKNMVNIEDVYVGYSNGRGFTERFYKRLNKEGML